MNNISYVDTLLYFLAYPIYVFGFLLALLEVIFLVKDSGKYFFFASNIFIIIFEFIVIAVFKINTFDKNMIHTPYFEIKFSVYQFCILLILYDLFFYIEHFLMHKLKLLQAIHYVHHSSKVFDLSVGFRLSWFRKIRRLVFFIPLLFIGFDATLIILAMSLVNAYAFFVHSATKIRYPKFLFFLVSPALHSIHHYERTKLLNIGGMFTVWDHLFNTFEDKLDTFPVFGVKGYVISLNPIKNEIYSLYLYFKHCLKIK